MDRDIRTEIYLALLLLGAEPMLLSAVAAWRAGGDDKDTLADLRNWNEAKLAELKEWLSTMTEGELEAVQQRIRQYEEARGALKRAA